VAQLETVMSVSKYKFARWVRTRITGTLWRSNIFAESNIMTDLSSLVAPWQSQKAVWMDGL
jgi:hypothetical protein